MPAAYKRALVHKSLEIEGSRSGVNMGRSKFTATQNLTERGLLWKEGLCGYNQGLETASAWIRGGPQIQGLESVQDREGDWVQSDTQTEVEAKGTRRQRLA